MCVLARKGRGKRTPKCLKFRGERKGSIQEDKSGGFEWFFERVIGARVSLVHKAKHIANLTIQKKKTEHGNDNKENTWLLRVLVDKEAIDKKNCKGLRIQGGAVGQPWKKCRRNAKSQITNCKKKIRSIQETSSLHLILSGRGE